MMTPRKEDIWADLRYALNELNRPPLDMNRRLTDAAHLDGQPEQEFFTRRILTRPLSDTYWRAQVRADSSNAHEAIEKGLKAILIECGVTKKHVRSRGHQLHELLADVKQASPSAFNELERCFRSTIRHLKSVTGIQHNANIIEYFQEHGETKIFVASRYASIEEGHDAAWGMIGLVYIEIIRALSALVVGLTPKDINHRIEEAATKAVLTESQRWPKWDAVEWLNRGPVRPRLEVIKDWETNRVLRHALRRCAREYTNKDLGIWGWADRFRRRHVARRMRSLV